MAPLDRTARCVSIIVERSAKHLFGVSISSCDARRDGKEGEEKEAEAGRQALGGGIEAHFGFSSAYASGAAARSMGLGLGISLLRNDWRVTNTKHCAKSTSSTILNIAT